MADLKGVDPDVMARYERVISRFGKELPITSGFRGPKRNKKAGGAKKSQHLHGKALDVSVRKMPVKERLRLIRIASEEGFTGIGVYNNGLHFDLGSPRSWGPSFKKESVPKWARATIGEHLSGKIAPSSATPAAATETDPGSVLAGAPIPEPQSEGVQVAGGDDDLIRQVIEEMNQEGPKALEGSDAALDEVLRELNGPEERIGVEPADFLFSVATPLGPVGALAARALPQGVRDRANALVQGVTGEFGDEIVGLGNSAVQNLAGVENPQSPGQAADQVRRRNDAFSESNPVESTALKVLGGGGAALATGGAGLTFLKGGRGVGETVARGAADGAAFGGLFGAGASDGEDVVKNTAEGVIGGAVIGGALARAGVSFERYLNLRAQMKAAPDGADIKTASQELFKAAEKSGIIYKPQSVSNMVDDLSARMVGETIDKEIHPMASRVMKRMPELLGKPATLKEVERFRSLAGQAAQSAKPGSADQRLAMMIRESLDDFSLDQGNMVAAESGAELQKQARKLWAQFRKDEVVSQAVEKAVRRAASTGSGGNINNAIQQNLRRVLENKKLSSGFTAEERAALEAVIGGKPIDSLLRLVGKLSPSGNGLMMALHGAGALQTGGGSLIAAGVGMGAKSLADRGTTRRVATLAAIIRSGGNAPKSKLAQLMPLERQALARIIAAEGGEPLGQLPNRTANPR